MADTTRELVARIEAGQREAEVELVQQFSMGIRLILLKRTGNPHLANDLAQDTFVVVLRRLRAGELNHAERLAAFIRQVAINLSIEYFRKEKRYVHQSDEIISLHTTHRDNKDKHLDRQKTREMLEQTLERLSMPRDRELLRRFYLLDEDKERICDDFGLTTNHFDRVLYRAKQRMRELIDQEKELKSMLFGGLFDG